MNLTKDNIKSENYTKHIFDILLSHQEQAMQNAEKLLKSYGTLHNPDTDNPATTVHELVKLLTTIGKD